MMVLKCTNTLEKCDKECVCVYVCMCVCVLFFLGFTREYQYLHRESKGGNKENCVEGEGVVQSDKRLI